MLKNRFLCYNIDKKGGILMNNNNDYLNQPIKKNDEHASMEAVEQADKAYWDRMMIDTSHKDYARYAELEKAYFDCITPKFNINDNDMIQQVLTAQQEKFVAYIKERYGNYLSEVLEQFGYGQQDNNRSPKR